MSSQANIQAAGQTHARHHPYGNLIGSGQTVPADASIGWAPGALFADIDADGSLVWYQNIGTKASSLFVRQALADLGNGVIAIAPASAATLSITSALHHGRTIYVTKTDGWNATLPVPVAGMKFRIVLGATIATASTIKSVAGTHLMIGHALMGNDTDNTTVLFQALAASTFDTIDLLGTGNSTGGIAGQVITIEAMNSTTWYVEIIGDAAGTEASPFSNTVA